MCAYFFHYTFFSFGPNSLRLWCYIIATFFFALVCSFRISNLKSIFECCFFCHWSTYVHCLLWKPDFEQWISSWRWSVQTVCDIFSPSICICHDINTYKNQDKKLTHLSLASFSLFTEYFLFHYISLYVSLYSFYWYVLHNLKSVSRNEKRFPSSIFFISFYDIIK